MMEDIFWADKIASEVIKREKYTYLNKKYALPDRPTIKTSSSLSGVLHIGRLTDIIRGEAVYRALKDKGLSPRFIYVAEDMDPLRKVPKGVPSSYREYIGMPVTDIPDPWGCHKSYAEHHIAEFVDVFPDFVEEVPERFSMREEYKKGSFDEAVHIILSKLDSLRELLNGFRRQKLPDNWLPYQVVCENCGKIMTTVPIALEGGRVHYVCQDYSFKSEKAEGCGYEGEVKPEGGNGKLVWKSEWAAQWRRWDVVAEGAGKEYIVPNSAFFVNAHISEEILDFPSPTPIFYEYITIGGGKMSASLGNVVYPKDWLEVAPAEALRLLFLKRITKSRDFKWEDVPRIVDELERIERIYYGLENLEDKKEEKHLKRLYELVQIRRPPDTYTLRIPYTTAVIVSQVVDLNDEKRLKTVFDKMGYPLNADSLHILRLAGRWASKYSKRLVVLEEMPSEAGSLREELRSALRDVAKSVDEETGDLTKRIFAIAKSHNIKPQELFRAIYLLFLGREDGPRAGPFLLSLDKDFVKKRLKLES